MSDAMKDIEAALFDLRQAFAKHKIPLPDVLEYSDSRKGYDASMRLRLASKQNANWVMDQSAKPYAEMSLAGYTVRFEARKVERPGTGAELDDGESGYIFRDK